MMKLAIYIVVLVGATWLVVQNVPSLRQWAVEIINPAVREGKVLGILKTNMDDLEGVLNDLSQAKNVQEAKTAAEKGRAILKDSSTLVQEVSAINGSISKALGSQLNKVLDVLGINSAPSPTADMPLRSCSPQN